MINYTVNVDFEYKIVIQKNEKYSYLISHTKINFEWIKDVNIGKIT